MRISDWSSDVCSSDLPAAPGAPSSVRANIRRGRAASTKAMRASCRHLRRIAAAAEALAERRQPVAHPAPHKHEEERDEEDGEQGRGQHPADHRGADRDTAVRSEEHTSELQSLMRISYAVFCLKKKTQHKKNVR